jgi:transposase
MWPGRTGRLVSCPRVDLPTPPWRVHQHEAGVHLLAALFVAEIGDVTRFPGPRQLCSWAGLTPRHHESDTVVRRGSISKQGSKLVRWAAVEAVTQARGTSKIQVDRHRIAERRGTGIAKVAAARKLLTLVYYGLRDGEIRCLTRPQAA